jgi:hypothetical protein
MGRAKNKSANIGVFVYTSREGVQFISAKDKRRVASLIGVEWIRNLSVLASMIQALAITLTMLNGDAPGIGNVALLVGLLILSVGSYLFRKSRTVAAIQVGDLAEAQGPVVVMPDWMKQFWREDGISGQIQQQEL